MGDRTYVAIDLKSFYASVECVERELDPLRANLVVADASRTEKTICLAVSPSFKACGIPGRPRLFEVVQKVREINAARRRSAPGGAFAGSSCDALELQASPELSLDYIVATPQMSRYIEVSTQIYSIYLQYIAPEDIHVYSIDEVFMDVTGYLGIYGLTARELAMKMVRDVLGATGITATAGIGTNMYLCKVAMDIMAKRAVPDEYGMRIAELDEAGYRRSLWNHRPLTDFWRIGAGYAKKLEANGLHTMGDVARCSLGKPGGRYGEDLLYRLFGANAELLIDHAWGWEPCTMEDVKAYRPRARSLGSGQVLQRPYTFGEARLAVREMCDLLALDLLEKGLATDRVVLAVGFAAIAPGGRQEDGAYRGDVGTDRYGRTVPKHARGTADLGRRTSSAKLITDSVMELYDRIVDRGLLVKRLNIAAIGIVSEADAAGADAPEQLDLFADYGALRAERDREEAGLERERRAQEAVLRIKGKYGKNAVLKGMNLREDATTMARNGQIGGHRA